MNLSRPEKVLETAVLSIPVGQPALEWHSIDVYSLSKSHWSFSTPLSSLSFLWTWLKAQNLASRCLRMKTFHWSLPSPLEGYIRCWLYRRGESADKCSAFNALARPPFLVGSKERDRFRMRNSRTNISLIGGRRWSHGVLRSPQCGRSILRFPLLTVWQTKWKLVTDYALDTIQWIGTGNTQTRAPNASESAGFIGCEFLCDSKLVTPTWCAIHKKFITFFLPLSIRSETFVNHPYINYSYT